MAELPPKLRIFRARTLEAENLYKLYRKLTGQLGETLDTRPSSQPYQPSLLARLQALLFIPDGRIGWFPWAIRTGKQILKKENPSVIFSSSGPPTAHLIARKLARRNRLPLVIEFRDPWVNYQYLPASTRFHRWLAEKMEAQCVRQADRVICVTSLMTDEMRLRYPEEPPGKFLTITNGFDPTDFDPEIAPTSEYFLIRHMGTLHSGRTALPFLKGLFLALEREEQLHKNLKVEFVGSMDRWNESAFDTFVEKHDLETLISRRSFVPHHQAIQMMQKAQVQLLIMGRGIRIEQIYPAKLFEYLGARRPILAVAPPGVTADLVRELGAGTVGDRDDPQSVADAILTLYKSFQNGNLSEYAPDDLEPFTRQYQARQLADVLDNVVKTHPHAMG
jgi:glycosyltransferase involved in cell wall biosynthesis